MTGGQIRCMLQFGRYHNTIFLILSLVVCCSMNFGVCLLSLDPSDIAE